MRVTRELKEKLTRLIDAKYYIRTQELSNKIMELSKVDSVAITKDLREACGKYPYVNNYFKKILGTRDLGDYVRNNSYYFNETKSDEIIGIEKEILNNRTNARLETENALIALSYGKDLNDIRAIFSQYGIEF